MGSPTSEPNQEWTWPEWWSDGKLGNKEQLRQLVHDLHGRAFRAESLLAVERERRQRAEEERDEARGHVENGVAAHLRAIARADDYAARAQRLVEALEEIRGWASNQRAYCRPPKLADAPPEEVDERRGPCAAYGATVHGLFIDKLDAALASVPDREEE